MSAFERAYIDLVGIVAQQGEGRLSRVGHTRQVFASMLHIDTLGDGYFPMLTTRQIYYKGVLGELAAFLRGATHLSEFNRFGCKYWDDNALAWPPNKHKLYKNIQVGRIYGAQWRNWEGDDDFPGFDQIKTLVEGINKDPQSRRHLLTTYNPSELHLGCLPPCHLLAQFNVRSSALDCMVTMRSVDLCLGLPSDIVLYAALMLLVARATQLTAGRLTFVMGDTHIYENHVDTWLEQARNPVVDLPMFSLHPNATLDNFLPEHLEIINYQHSTGIKYPLNT